MKYFFIVLLLLFTGFGCQKNIVVPANVNINQDATNIQSEISSLEPELQKVIDVGGGISTVRDEKKPDRLVLNNIGINLGSYNPKTNMAGDILFTKNIDSHYGRKSFLEFGTTLTGPSGTDIMPHPTYILPLGTKVFSPVNGKVDTVRYQAESGDYEIVIVPDGFPKWRISFDHVIDLSFRKGDTLQVNNIIAKVAPSRSSAVPSDFGLVEFQVWEESSSFFSREPGDSTCPFLLLTENAKQNIVSLITQLAAEWEKYIGEDVYNEDNWVFPGCLLEKARS